ncbi:hypothetical protein B9T26_14920 [Acinetobacter sp. ANC 4169]|nr:hypothetical protein B9T26_14920 [Acinetobacter sp. ANC 4169]
MILLLNPFSILIWKLKTLKSPTNTILLLFICFLFFNGSTLNISKFQKHETLCAILVTTYKFDIH